MGRQVLAATLDLYVSTSGSDVTGNGSIGAPWATLQFALDYISTSLDFGGQNVNLHIVDPGTYVGASVKSMVGGGQLNIFGETGVPSDYIITGVRSFVFFANNETIICFDALTFKPSFQALGVFARVSLADFATVGELAFDCTGGAQVFAKLPAAGAQYNSNGPNMAVTWPNGNMQNFWNVGAPGVYVNSGLVCTATGSVNFTLATVSANLGAVINYAESFTGGTITGKRFNVNTNATMTTSIGGPEGVPGSIAGTVESGGVVA